MDICQVIEGGRPFLSVKQEKTLISQGFLSELMTGIGPVTSSLPMRCATDCATSAFGCSETSFAIVSYFHLKRKHNLSKFILFLFRLFLSWFYLHIPDPSQLLLTALDGIVHRFRRHGQLSGNLLITFSLNEKLHDPAFLLAENIL